MENVLTKTSSSSADSDITRAPPNSLLPPKKEAGGWRSVKYILGN
jgi:peptide/histidine transporter 3/4